MEASHRLSVAFLIDYYGGPGAGTERQMLLLAEALPQAGIDVRMAVFRHSDYTRKGGFVVPVEALDVGRVMSPLSWWRVYRWARRARADGVSVVHIFFNDPALFAPAAIALAGLRCIVARRDMGYWYTPVRLFMLRRMQRFVTRMTANSNAVAAHCGETECYPQEKRTVIGNAVAPARADSRERRGDTFRVGIVANIRPIKRIGDAIRAIALLNESGKSVTLRVVGGGDRGELEALALTLGVSGQVEFAGATQHVAEELAGLDVAILCSESEGLSNAIMEYMQAGLPVVATDSGGNAELVTEGSTGLLYPVGDVEALARCVGALRDDPALAGRMGAAGASRIQRDYAADRIAAAYASLYRDVAGDSEQASVARGGERREVP